ncbi:MAG: zf-HC2 domain-containing protein, partial [candidate division WOR-3 bacterium]
MSSFECQQIRVQLAAFLEDGISEAERIIVRLHLQNCPGCQREMEVLQCVPLIVKEWQPEVPTRTMWVYIEQRIKIPQGVSERARVKP